MKDNLQIEGLISVIIPCYNHGKFIDESVDSVLQQTYSNFEIIIIDAGSDDLTTAEKLRHYSKPFTKVITAPQQIFPSEARNLGFSRARGEFILTLDADDLLEKTFMEKTIDKMRSDPQFGAVSSKVMYFGYEEGFMDYRGGLLEDNLENMGSHLCALIRTKAWVEIGGFDENIIDGYEDWEFWFRLTKMNWSMGIVPEILFYYRQKESSRVTEVFKYQDKLIKAIRNKHADVYSNPYKYMKAALKNRRDQ